jgi:protease II
MCVMVCAGAPCCDADVQDCLTTMLDESIPLTTIEWEEWGNPKDPQFYQ